MLAVAAIHLHAHTHTHTHTHCCCTCRVGEAERQLRLLFEEASRRAPSIIFFDEIDGLAPVRSSKQVGRPAAPVLVFLLHCKGDRLCWPTGSVCEGCYHVSS